MWRWGVAVAAVYRARGYLIKVERATEKDKSTDTNETVATEHLVSVTQIVSSEDYLPKRNPDKYSNADPVV